MNIYTNKTHASPPPKMAQLPPKVPTQWPQMTTMPSSFPNPSWVDEFLDFSSARRVHHRRSASDSLACAVDHTDDDFNRIDDAQLMSMFNDHVDAGPPPPSTPSDRGSADDEEKPAEVVQSQCKAETEMATDASAEPVVVDPKRVKRILANRQSAQRSRLRKLQYIAELERNVTALQTEVSALSPRVAYLDHQRSVLTIGNSHLKQRIAALAQDGIFKDAHQEALKKEVERLRQKYHQQSLKKTDAAAEAAPAVPTEKELLGQ